MKVVLSDFQLTTSECALQALDKLLEDMFSARDLDVVDVQRGYEVQLTMFVVPDDQLGVVCSWSGSTHSVRGPS